MAYSGWLLPDKDRNILFSKFHPLYPDVIAHHVTLQMGKAENLVLPLETEGAVVGVANDHHGIQALVIKISGTVRRPDGGVYHITWSIDRAAGYKPVDSNGLVESHGWEMVPDTRISLVPTIFK